MENSAGPIQDNYRSVDGLWTCDVCAAVFHRLDHFKRHSAIHKTDRPFLCDFCGSLYKRGDVLRRHWKTCSARIETGQAIPQPRLGGKEKHACDGCAKLKRLCSGGHPCMECSSRGKSCSYQRLNGSEPLSAEWGITAQGYNINQVESWGNFSPEPASKHSTWDLGPQTFYPSRNICYEAYNRRS